MTCNTSNRSEITGELSFMVERKLMNQTPYWASEVDTEIDSNRSPRVDFMAYMPDFKTLDFYSAGAIELGEFWFFEVKSCMADFNSGHGLTFEGDRNFLVCERELAEELYMSLKLPAYADVLCPDKSRKRLITVFEGRRKPRKHSATLLLFLMMQRIKNGDVISSHGFEEVAR